MANYYIDMIQALKIAAQKSKDYTDEKLADSSSNASAINALIANYLKDQLNLVEKDGQLCFITEEG